MLQVCEATKEEPGNHLAPSRQGGRAACSRIPGNTIRFSCDPTGRVSFNRLTVGLQRANPDPLPQDPARRRLFQIR
jgi:hypothetical protein